MPQYQEDLDAKVVQGCADPNCREVHNEMYLHQSCHLKAGLEAMYTATDGTLILACMVCHKPVANLQIAKRP